MPFVRISLYKFFSLLSFRVNELSCVMSSRSRLTPTGKLLLRACIKGDMTLAQSVLFTDPAALNARNKHGLNTLQVAIIHQQLRMARFLIDKGVNVRSVDKSGWTPLHDAALYGNKELIGKIIAEGSRVTSSNQLGEKPIDLARDVATEKLLCKYMTEAGFDVLSEQYRRTLGLDHLQDENDSSDTSDVAREEDEVPIKQGDGENQHPSRSQNDVITSGETINTSNYRARDFRMSRECHYAAQREAIPMDINRPCGRLSSIKRDPALSPSFRESRRRRTPLSPLREDIETAAVAGLFETDSPTPRRRRSSPVPRQRRSLVALTGSSKNQLRSHSFSEPDSSANEEMHLTPEDIARLNRLFEKSQAAASTETHDQEESETPPDRESPVELLKTRPRKPSIVSRDRRKESDDVSIGSRRRSVSFQPEVLLQEIVTEGDATLVGEVLSSGIVTDVNKMSPVGLTALHQSALDGNLACAKTLVVNGADVNIVDSDGWTPLHAAAANGHPDIVRYLLKSGSDPSVKTDDGKTPSDLSTRRAIRRMLVRASSGSILDPLEDDASDGELSSEEEEECNHADYDSDDEDSSLSDSDHKVSPTANRTISILGESPEDCRDSSVSPSPIREPMDNVFSNLHTPSVTTVLERDPSDSTSSYGSLLEQEGEIPVVTPSTLCNDDILILSDTEREILNSEDQGFSTMDASSDSSHHKITFSDDEGTSHDVLDSDLQPGTLDYRFQEAVLNGDVDSLMKLVKHKSDILVNRVNKTSGVSALHHSVLEENFILVQHLVKDFDCDPNLQDVDGWTPLHAASAVGDMRIAQFLLDNGARASILNNNGVFAVDVAEDKAMEELLKKAMLGPLHIAAAKTMIKGFCMC